MILKLIFFLARINSFRGTVKWILRFFLKTCELERILCDSMIYSPQSRIVDRSTLDGFSNSSSTSFIEKPEIKNERFGFENNANSKKPSKKGCKNKVCEEISCYECSNVRIGFDQLEAAILSLKMSKNTVVSGALKVDNFNRAKKYHQKIFAIKIYYKGKLTKLIMKNIIEEKKKYLYAALWVVIRHIYEYNSLSKMINDLCLINYEESLIAVDFGDKDAVQLRSNGTYLDHFRYLSNIWCNLMCSEDELNILDLETARKSNLFDSFIDDHSILSTSLPDCSSDATTNIYKSVPNRPSEEWKRLGFQGTDPVTDLRGLGIFGLICLEWITNPVHNVYNRKMIRKIFKESLDPVHGYPFAISVFNVAYDLKKMLSTGKLREQVSDIDNFVEMDQRDFILPFGISKILRPKKHSKEIIIDDANNIGLDDNNSSSGNNYHVGYSNFSVQLKTDNFFKLLIDVFIQFHYFWMNSKQPNILRYNELKKTFLDKYFVSNK